MPDDCQCRASLNEIQSRSSYYTASLINSHSMRRWETNSNKIKIVVRKTYSPPACYSNDNVVTQKGKKPKCESRVFKQRICMHLDIVIFYKWFALSIDRGRGAPVECNGTVPCTVWKKEKEERRAKGRRRSRDLSFSFAETQIDSLFGSECEKSTGGEWKERRDLQLLVTTSKIQKYK